MLWTLILSVLGYVLGSIPFGVIIGKGVKGVDLRQVGSGNIGTANAFRALGPFWGTMVFAGDVLKGVLPVLLAASLPRWIPGSIPVSLQFWAQALAGFSAIIGHNYPVFLGFSGGKGIATSFGVFLVLEWKAALLSLLVWVVIILATRVSSLGSLLGALAVPSFMIYFKKPYPYALFAFITVAMAFYQHRGNIGRLLKGEERKITDKAEDEPAPAPSGTEAGGESR
jgi:glycerol-3-phosphate acyltransferase PlsY